MIFVTLCHDTLHTVHIKLYVLTAMTPRVCCRKITDLAALASEFFAFGALGSETKDLAAKRSLLEAVDVFFKLRTKESFAASS